MNGLDVSALMRCTQSPAQHVLFTSLHPQRRSKRRCICAAADKDPLLLRVARGEGDTSTAALEVYCKDMKGTS